MIRKIVSIAAIILFAFMIIPLIIQITPFSELSSTAKQYVEKAPHETGAANIVSSILVTYRGLDTLGEVTVLFIATAGVGFLLRKQKSESGSNSAKQTRASEILKTGSRVLLPVILLFGVYIFLHGHLTPGGGFQGGVVIASGMVLLLLSQTSQKLNHTIMNVLESFSGFIYVLIGVAGIYFAAGFLDNKILPVGNIGALLSAGAIPVIYMLIGLKVGTELTSIANSLKQDKE